MRKLADTCITYVSETSYRSKNINKNLNYDHKWFCYNIKINKQLYEYLNDIGA